MNKTHVVLLLVALVGAVASAWAVATTGDADELRRGARVARAYDGRHASRHPMPQHVLGELPEAPQRIVVEHCFDSKEGGDTLGVQNCYDDAAVWMRHIADEDEQRRDFGIIGLALSALLGGGVLFTRRLGRRAAEPFTAAKDD